MIQIRQRLAFRVFFPIVAFTLVLGSATYLFIVYATSSFAHEQAENNLRWRSYAVQQIVDSNVNELQRTRKAADPASVRDRKVNTLVAFEDFARTNGLRIDVFDAATKILTSSGDLPQAPDYAIQKSLDSVHQFGVGKDRYYMYTFMFEPWQWRITLVQDSHAYDNFMQNLAHGIWIGAGTLIGAAFLFMLHLTVSMRRPIMRIIRDLKVNQQPSYRGIAEFEYLSNSISAMMDAVCEKNAAVERYRDDLEVLVQERTTELTKANDELKKTNQRLEETHQQLLQSEKLASIGQLAAGVAHEINNPIGFVNSNVGTMQGYITDLLRLIRAYEEHQEILRQAAPQLAGGIDALRKEIDLDFIKEDIAGLLEESKDGLGRVTKIVQDLKDFSRVGEADWHYANLERNIDTTLNIIWNELKYKVRIVKEYGGLPEVECLPSELNQVFMNILLNAGQAIERNGTITLRTRVQDNEAWIDIQDTGCGIPAENLNRIFDPFFTTKPIGKGTGLGLSLAYGIMRKHQGTIDVESEVGRGTLFRLRLPLARPASVEAQDQAEGVTQQA
ncbi:MAG TPA: ATP-binding protein [Noviherbaspirillum sp.]|uniref:ATP-binding protein n=1 Tax=Noviherbaspirillum sp. TaxID=1926288 RepID=UPI002D6D39C3|nr:ATP-binding protein [Noviherbaspirillum sp.]HYD95901.1 ATP-binding protein [Noviherbaspirillum sp.]